METEGLNAAQLARKISVDRAYISMLKSGKRANPSPEITAKIAEALLVTEGWLLTGSQPKYRSLACDSDAGNVTMLNDSVASPLSKAKIPGTFQKLAETADLHWLIERMEILSKEASAGDLLAAETITDLIPIVRRRIDSLSPPKS